MWQVAEAKNRFSELITRALREGPQRVRRRGEEVVVVSARDYAALVAGRAGPAEAAAADEDPFDAPASTDAELPNRHPDGKPPSEMTLGEFLVYCAPDFTGVEFERDRSLPREVDFGPDDETPERGGGTP